jgi:hypothetical protein
LGVTRVMAPKCVRARKAAAVLVLLASALSVSAAAPCATSIPDGKYVAVVGSPNDCATSGITFAEFAPPAAPGQYNSVPGSNGTVDTSGGTAGSINTVAYCPAGKYQDTAGQGACDECAPGTWGAVSAGQTTAAVACTGQCAAGKSGFGRRNVTSAISACISCAAGKYQNGIGHPCRLSVLSSLGRRQYCKT